MSIAFLITSPYQVYHYKQIAVHLDDVTAVIETRDREFGLSEDFVSQHLPGCRLEVVAREHLTTLDGRFAAIVCQTPILPLEFLEKSLVVAQQYSLAKERYQYGVWRAHAHLNLMYGHYSVAKVKGFSHAIAVGNPLLDPYFNRAPQPRLSFGSVRDRRPRLLYMPTYGELSSLDGVIRHLSGVEADITVKLHHAHDLASLGKVPDDLRVVRSDVDPVSLFLEHDGVISDFSGAAFDALYAGLPVVLTGAANPHARDFKRLARDESDRSLLRDVTAMWSPGGDLLGAFEAAGGRLNTPDYIAFRERLFVNQGSAGSACAKEIRRLLADGPPAHFGAEQVRDTTKRYIVANRQLRSRLEAKSVRRVSKSILGRSPIRSLAASGGRRLYDRLATSATARRVRRYALAILRRIRTRQTAWYGQLAPAPAERREEVVRTLLPYLQQAGVSIARDHGEVGADAAILAEAIPGVHHALRLVSSARPDLVARLGKGTRIVSTRTLARLRIRDLRDADWIEIGSTRELGPYRIGTDGYLSVQIVEHDSTRNRYLARQLRAKRVDWTSLLRPATAHVDDRVVAAVGTKREHVAAPVDAVYTWVDSGDPGWRRSHQEHSEEYQAHNESANNDERYLDRDELRYSLRSLWLFAPFIRNIYIVTADQHPKWLRGDDPRVSVVSHREIFPDTSVLPTFNSHAIEACLHRIPGLAENFLYFNDDVFLGREVTEDDFFTRAGLAKVYLSPSSFIYEGRPEASAIPTDWAAYNSVRLIEEHFELSFDRRVQHVPLTLNRTVLEEVEEKFQGEIERTRASRFRSTTDLAVPSMLAQYYAIATGRAVEWPTSPYGHIYLDTGRKDASERYEWIYRRRPKFFCLNVTRHTDVDLATQEKQLGDFMSAAFPTPAPWEI